MSNFFERNYQALVQQLQTSNGQFSPREFSKAFSLILRPEIIIINNILLIIRFQLLESDYSLLVIYLMSIFPTGHLSAILTGVEAKTKIRPSSVCMSSSRRREYMRSWITSSWLEDNHSWKTTATLRKLRKGRIQQR